MYQTGFWAPVGHKPSRSKHRRHSASEHISSLGCLCPQGNHWPAHYNGSQSPRRCQDTGSQCLGGPTLPSCYTGSQPSDGPTLPSRYPSSQRSDGLMLPLCSTGSVSSTLADTWSSTPRCKHSWVSLINLNSTQNPCGPFQGPTYSQRSSPQNLALSFAIGHRCSIPSPSCMSSVFKSIWTNQKWVLNFNIVGWFLFKYESAHLISWRIFLEKKSFKRHIVDFVGHSL